MNKPLLTTGALLLGALTFAMPKQAAADIRVRVGGGVRIGSPRWHRPVYRPYYRPHYAIGGAIWVGGGTYGGYGYRTYAAPPPAPSCDCGPGAVPSYYPGYYSTAQPSTYAPAVAPAGESLPSFGIGGFVGSVDVDGEAGSDVGLMARLRLSGGLFLEGELGATEMQYEHDQGLDPRSRIGASLVYEIGTANTWAPYLVAGLGSTHVAGDHGDSQGFGEVGIGLRWAVSNHFHLALDVRAGTQETAAIADSPTIAARVVVPDPTFDSNTNESYTRGRLSAMLYF